MSLIVATFAIPVAAQNSTKRRRRSYPGYCEKTKDDEGYCSLGNKGSWQASRYGITSLEHCALKCLTCANCRFVSFSSQNNDCSWYRDCRLADLRQGHGTVSAQVAGTTEASWKLTPLIVPLHVANTINGELADLPPEGDILIEIGSSDRNTADVELLPRIPTAFLISAEPLLDKYARAVGRRAPASEVRDATEPLSRHHDRGIVLPIAIGPAPAAGRTARFNTHGGCSSLLSVRRNASFGTWCFGVDEQRHVPVYPLSQLLALVGPQRHVQLIKIDAQGADLSIVQSGGAALRQQVRFVQMEVVADDCSVLYAGQPQCGAVLREMAALGFVPIGPTPCTPAMGRARHNHYCELEVVFENTRGPRGGDGWDRTPAYIFEYHKLHYNGCARSAAGGGGPPPHEMMARMAHAPPPSDEIVALSSSSTGVPAWFASRGDTGNRIVRNHSGGQLYVCPCACAAPALDSKRNDAAPCPLTERCPWGNTNRWNAEVRAASKLRASNAHPPRPAARSANMIERADVDVDADVR